MTFIWIFYRYFLFSFFLTIEQQRNYERKDYEKNISIVVYSLLLLFSNNTSFCTPFTFSFFIPIILEAIQYYDFMLGRLGENFFILLLKQLCTLYGLYFHHKFSKMIFHNAHHRNQHTRCRVIEKEKSKVNKRLDEIQKFHFLISEKNSTLRKFKAIHQGRVVYIYYVPSCFLRGQISYFNIFQRRRETQTGK